ncbi:hypothetical protein N9597_00145 [Candidatus Marinimicrobia bacterium]|nr:hypothetical protein [Candidatus Neomarinimicrobiota bacterium]
MKKILLISLSMLFAGEMEVDGDLNVSGNIQSSTIEELQAQITALQQGADNKLETRIYQVDMTLIDDELVPLNLNEITGYDLEYPILFLTSIDVDVFDNNDEIYVKSRSQYLVSNGNTSNRMHPFFTINISGQVFDTYHIVPSTDGLFYLESDRTLSGTFNFAITAKFNQPRTQK